MKIDTNERGQITLEEIYNEIEISPSNGSSILICERDGLLEILANGICYQVTKKGDIIEVG